MTATDMTPTTPSPVRVTLQAEGAALAAISIFAYSQMQGGWGLFALLILAPDLLMLGYLAGNRLGALSYNLAHSTIGPLALLAGAFPADWSLGLDLGLIWLAHIGLDRAIGYGLKYPGAFKDTHFARL